MPIIDGLRSVCSVTNDNFFHGVEAYILHFELEKAVVTIRIKLADYTGADLLFTHMTTRPEEAKRKGLGTRAVQAVLEWAEENNLCDIRAVQVTPTPEAESFWKKNGFVPMNNECNDYVFQRSKSPQ